MFLRTSFTPNQITLLSGIFGIIGAVLLISQNHLLLVLAALCVQIFAILDLVDGNIARAKNIQSKFGQWLDVFFDKLNDFLLIIGITIGAYLAVGKVYIFLLGISLMGFVFFIQFVMMLNHTVLRVEKNRTNTGNGDVKSQNHNKTSGPYVALQFTSKHCTLGHSTFLFLISPFACLNTLYFGLWFLTIHACLTLVLMITYTFYRLWIYERISVNS